jgi:hypothetical protein
LIYDKGAWILHMLRMLIGDDAFFSFLNDYAMAPELALGTVTLDDMIGFAERSAGRDLTGFFEPWVTTSAVPVVGTGIVTVMDRQGRHGVKVTFSQFQETVFEFAVPVEIHAGCSEVRDTVILNRKKQSFTWWTGCTVDSVSIDPEGMVLMRTATTPPPVLEVVGPWPNPAPTSGAEFRIYLTADKEVVVKTYDARGSLRDSINLGLLAATGLADHPDNEPHLWTWPGSSRTSRIPSGIFWVEFNAEGARAVKKLTHLH